MTVFRKKIENATQQGRVLVSGLDIEPKHIPDDFAAAMVNDPEERLTRFVCHFIDLIAPFSAAVKPNLAFYLGSKGGARLEAVCNYLKERYPHLGTISDGKHGDIGNTNDQFTKYYLEQLGFDAMTLNPFMGWEDCMASFLRNWVNHDFFVLGLTSNVGNKYFMRDNISMIANFAHQDKTWNEHGNLNFVVGGTNPAQQIALFREHAGNRPMFLEPGYGAQGGAMEAVVAGKAEGEFPNVLPMVGRQLIAPTRLEDESYDNAVIRTAKFYQDEFARLLGLQVPA